VPPEHVQWDVVGEGKREEGVVWSEVVGYGSRRSGSGGGDGGGGGLRGGWARRGVGRWEGDGLRARRGVGRWEGDGMVATVGC
jgi:hypothetical protein